MYIGIPVPCYYLHSCCLSKSVNIDEKCTEKNPLSVSIQCNHRLHYHWPNCFNGTNWRTKTYCCPEVHQGINPVLHIGKNNCLLETL